MRIIGGKWRGRKLAPVRSGGVRPTTDRVREAWMSILQHRLPGASVLDLFAGSGAVGLEAISRGAAHVVFVEQSRSAARVLKRNVSELGASEECTVVVADALAYVRRRSLLSCDLALADPPYGRGLASRLMSSYLRVPFSHELWVEHRRDEVLPPEMIAAQRRYGDTMLTGVTAPAGVTASAGATALAAACAAPRTKGAAPLERGAS